MDLKELAIQHKNTLSKIGLVITIIIVFALMLQQPVNSDYIDSWIPAIGKTILISIVAIVMGFGIGIIIGLGRISRNFIINGVATVYVEILRGVPLLIQIFFMYFALSIYVPSINDAAIAATLALGLNSGAYQAEIIRGGIQSISGGQMEAARSSGMSYIQAMRHVILPQGFRLIIPPMTNEYVTVIKDSSLAYAIGAMEVTWFSTKVITFHFEPLTTFLFVALIYFTLTTFTSNIMRVVERKFHIPGYMGAE